MKKLLALLVLIQAVVVTRADTLTLQQAYSFAEQNYPNIQQRVLFDNATQLKLKNLTSRYYPQASVNAQFTYQSEVPKFPDQVANFIKLDLPKEHFQALLDVNQTIYDGGAMQAGKKLERLQHDVDLQNIEVDLYSVRAKVNTYFFTVLVLQKRQEILDTNAVVLKTRIQQLTSGVKNGAVLESEVLKLQAELLKIEQSTDEIAASKGALTNALTVLLGKSINEQTVFATPDDDASALVKERPEFKYLELQQQRISANKQLTRVSNLPKLSAFAQGGVASPNQFNFLDSKTKPFYFLGARFSWNVTSWYTSGRENKLTDIQTQMLQVQRDNFQRNLDLAAANDNGEIQKLRKLINKDEELISTYSRILKNSSSQLDNGTITAADYIVDLNAESQARLNKQMHLLQLSQARVNYLTNQGKTLATESK